ncbi:ABC transporter permease [Streptomyces sp. CMB-StM0423]|uniref:ABC transporter permease n=1 Tax=Streptomyces sp. CMB-StM0423 TaxID=2059884 RepID=UPI000C70C9A1|nr:ABC transporter permease [Streptomyces sp. CMB-StM0423]AUH40223.1 ABC transporter permease [Streptomyces sp. CMB-StM0423]
MKGTSAEEIPPAGLRPGDVVRGGAVGLRTRPLRAVLSALGIAIGIAAMVAVVGISSSSRADLDRTLASLGTNLLTVSPGRTMSGGEAKLPARAESMVARIGPVTSVSAIGQVPDAHVYRTDRIPEAETGGLAAYAVRTGLPATTGARLRTGTWLNAATARYPAVVLGATAAERLGVGRAAPEVRVLVGGAWFTVVGILEPAPLAPELDTGALVGWRAAKDRLGFDGRATTVYMRSADAAVEEVQSVLGATANPAAPNEVEVSRPSDALAAKRAAGEAFTRLLLGVGAVALLVGGVGVANTMVISVLERRAEIGLRRALGATRGHIRTQFLAESLLLSALGGAAGALLGAGVTASYAASQSWPPVIPAWTLAGGLAATLTVGALAGLYPALHASRLSPTTALATP